MEGPVAWLLWRRLRSWTRQLALGAPCGTNVSCKKRSRRTELRRELRKEKVRNTFAFAPSACFSIIARLAQSPAGRELESNI